MVLLTVAVLAIAGISLPQTVSLFAGQHYWYDLSGIPSDVPCEKCHADIAAEMETTLGPHMGETGYGRMNCGLCHRTFTGYTYARESGNYTEAPGFEPGKEAHAASTVACIVCHKANSSIINEFDNCFKCHGDAFGIPSAGGFGLTEVAGDTGSMAAHLAFINEARKDDTLKDENEACIAYHTSIAVKINWTHSRSIEFNIGMGDQITTGTWTAQLDSHRLANKWYSICYNMGQHNWKWNNNLWQYRMAGQC